MSGVDSTIKPEAPKASVGQRAAIVAFAAIVVGVAIWGLTAGNRDGDPSSNAASAASLASVESGEAEIVNESELGGLPGEIGHGVYWAGTESGTQLEYSHDETGNVHIRYLTEGAEAGDPNQSYLNIGSYPFSGAYEATRKLANGPGLVKVTEHGGIGFFDPGNPYSVIIAWPSQPNLQVEVYDPEKNRALEVVRSGDIVPVS